MTDTSTELYIRPNLSEARLGLFIVGKLQPQRVMSLGWQRSVRPVWQDASTWERRARFVIRLRRSFPSLHFSGAAAQPHLCGVVGSTVLQHLLVVRHPCPSGTLSFEYSTSLDIWNYRIEKKFSKINIPRNNTLIQPPLKCAQHWWVAIAKVGCVV